MPKFEVPAVDGLSQAELNKATIRFNSTASGITGVVEDLRNEIRKIEDAIKADEDGEFEYEKVLGNLRNEKEDIKKRIAGCESYLQTFEDGPGAVIEKTYVDNTKAVKNLYNDARIGHQRGIEMLIQDFDYHPAFKQRDDAFSSVPFNPKRIWEDEICTEVADWCLRNGLESGYFLLTLYAYEHFFSFPRPKEKE